jgi:vancomycin permeability regulator SanA
MKERGSWQEYVLAGSAVLLTIGLPLGHLATTERVYTALTGGSVDCSHGEHTGKYPYGIIAVPGAGGYVDGNGQFQPNNFEERRLITAALVDPNDAAPIILLGEPESTRGEDKKYLQDQVIKLSDGKVELPDEKVYIDTNSINTATNMDALKAFMKKHGIENALIVTDEFHINRALILACGDGIDAEGLSVEVAIKNYDPELYPLIEKQDESEQVRDLVRLERLKVFLLAYDPNDVISTVIKRIENR